MKLKKIAYVLGTIAPITAPSFIAVSCGSEEKLDFNGVGIYLDPSLVQFLKEENKLDFSYKTTDSVNASDSQNLLKIQTDFGISFNDFSPESGFWKNISVRTLTFARDSIGVAVNLPKGVNLTNPEALPNVNIVELAKLYAGEDVSWNELVENVDAISANKNDLVKNVFAIKGGSDSSGISKTFMEKLNIVAKEHGVLANNPNLSEEDFLNHNLSSKLNSSLKSSKAILDKLELNEGSVSYFPTSLLLNSKLDNKEVKMANIFVPKDTFSNGEPSLNQTWELLSADGERNPDYIWKAAINVIYSTINDDSLEFVRKLFSESVQAKLKDLNYLPLSQDEIEAQIGDRKIGANIILSDYTFRNKFLKNTNKINNVEFFEIKNNYFGLANE